MNQLTVQWNFHSRVEKLGNVVRKHQVAIYVTIIFHLCFAIAMLGVKLRGIMEHPQPVEIVFDHSNVPQELLEAEKHKEELATLQEQKQNLEAEVNRMMREARGQGQRQANPLRNIAVNENEKGGGKRDKVFDENDALQKRIAATRGMMQPSTTGGNESTPSSTEKPAKTTEKVYSGPSVLSYNLKGRDAVKLPVPVYKCETAGKVVVNIEVAQQGTVSKVSVDAAKSAGDACLHEAAKRAAMLSRFTISESSKDQQGTITYQFIAQ